ncbi:hypothetical protein B5K08_19715 [Rhizobium leguminosarum bv. trifolii]|uniref:Uncharacterized protein n=1 Tax=Rhizobium leguminosarum bv. trifolii TaxID=386 RepID=A0A3E1BE93_RHILT|nr:hypothetical protein [Rhizobium leguminosarum]RFB89190.1 hypothetical protein B5K08_19715 [Rhizobium leguminosarum bv. trifolii]RFB90543.1 hypothetical protein B5K10_19705 [Rhizobium leguminosarum bv. trifolii]
MFGFLRRKAEPDPSPKILRVPSKEFNAAMGAAMAANHELEEIARRAKSRMRDQKRPIEQGDLEEVLRMLSDAKRRIDCEVEDETAKSDDESDTEWNKDGYDLLVAPIFRMANSPQEIIDLTLRAADGGAKSARLVYQLIIAEMDVAVARYYVTLNTGINTE